MSYFLPQRTYSFQSFSLFFYLVFQFGNLSCRHFISNNTNNDWIHENTFFNNKTVTEHTVSKCWSYNLTQYHSFNILVSLHEFTEGIRIALKRRRLDKENSLAEWEEIANSVSRDDAKQKGEKRGSVRT